MCGPLRQDNSEIFLRDFFGIPNSLSLYRPVFIFDEFADEAESDFSERDALPPLSDRGDEPWLGRCNHSVESLALKDVNVGLCCCDETER